MKKAIYVLAFLLFFTACSNEYMPEKLEVVESEEQVFTNKIEITIDDIKKLIPPQYEYQYISMDDIVGHIQYFSTIIKKNGDIYTQDVFKYNIDTGEVTHVADVSEMEIAVYNVYEIEGNIYFYAKPSVEFYKDFCIYTFKDNNFILLTDAVMNSVIEFENGIAFVDSSNWSIFKCTENGNKIICDPDMFPNILLEHNEMAFIGTDVATDNIYFCRYKNGKLIKNQIASPIHVNINPMSDIYLQTEGKSTEGRKLYAKNYNNETVALISENVKWGIVTDNRDHFVYRDIDEKIYQCIIDAKEDKIIKSELPEIDGNIMELRLAGDILRIGVSSMGERKYIFYTRQ